MRTVLRDPGEVERCYAIGSDVILLIYGAVGYVAVFVCAGVDVDDGDVADAARLRKEGPEEYRVVAFVICLGELVGVDSLHKRFTVGDDSPGL